MKKFLNKVAFVLVLLSVISVSNLNAQVYLRSIGIGGGMYSPSMDYWNENALSSWSDEFSGSLLGNVNLEFNIVSFVNIRIGGGYWSQTLEQGNIPFGTEMRTDEITVQMLPFNLDFILRTDDNFSFDFGLYGGIGAGVNFITLKYSTAIPSLGTFEEEHSGRDMLAHLILGADYKLMETFAIGVEARYALGRYQQQSKVNDIVYGHNVSIDGVQVMATFKYVFCGCED